MNELAGAWLLGVATAAALAAALAWWRGRRLRRSLRQIADGAGRLAAGELGHRLSVPAASELAALAAALNRLAGEVEERVVRLCAERDRLREELASLSAAASRDETHELRVAESRRDLVANVSHELKTPLTAIRGFAETLADGALADAAAGPRFVDRILEQCRRLESLLGDLLTLSRLEGPEPDGEEIVDLAPAVESAFEALRQRARERDVALILEAGDETPRIRGAGSEIDNVLLNLIDNAVKYNRSGGEVRVALRADGEDAVVEVSDTGIGIPREDLERVFERFYRVDKGRAREQGGTGLGLAIVKHAARRLGGRVEVESRLGEGTVFRVRLPGRRRVHRLITDLRRSRGAP